MKCGQAAEERAAKPGRGSRADSRDGKNRRRKEIGQRQDGDKTETGRKQDGD